MLKPTHIHTTRIIHAIYRSGAEQLADLDLPTRKQEPYRYTDLESLYRTDFSQGSIAAGGAALDAVKASIEPFLLKACEGQQMVFVNGVFNEALSDMSAAGGVEGLVVSHVGALEGAQLDEVSCNVEGYP